MAAFACGAKALPLFLVLAGAPRSFAFLRAGQSELQALLAAARPPAPGWACSDQLEKLLKLRRPSKAELLGGCRRLYSEQACREVLSKLGSRVPQPKDAAWACESLEQGRRGGPRARAPTALLETDTRRLLERRRGSLRASSGMRTGNDRLDLSVVTKRFDWEKNTSREPNDIDKATKSVNAATAATSITDPEVIARANYVRQAAKDLPVGMLGVAEKTEDSVEATSKASEAQDSNTSSVKTASEANTTEEEVSNVSEAEDSNKTTSESSGKIASEENETEEAEEEGEIKEEEQEQEVEEVEQADESEDPVDSDDNGEKVVSAPPTVATNKAVSSSVHCADFPHSWTSKNGLTCRDYQGNHLCNSTGGYGPGWGDSFGTFEDWANSETGITAVDACCVCGGGRRDQAAKTPAPTMEPPVKATPKPTPVLGEGIAGAGQYEVSCQNTPNHWASTGGASCEDYEHNGWCMQTGEYGPNWESDWPEFITYTGTSGLNALQACCACGGGSTGFNAAAQTTLVITPSTAMAPETGVVSEPPMQRSPKCEDSHADWKSSNGRTCLDYQGQQWCTPKGLYGPDWQPAWGTFAEWTSPETGDSADKVCCACGGGKKLD